MHTAYIDTGASVVWKDTTEHWYGPYSLALESGTFVVAGSAVGLLHNKIIAAEAGSYVVDGKAAKLLHNYVISLGSGSYIVVGMPASLYAPEVAIVSIAFSVWQSAVDEGSIIVWQMPVEILHKIESIPEALSKVVGSALDLTLRV